MTPDQSMFPLEVGKPSPVLIELFEANGGRASIMDALTTMLNRFSEDKGPVKPTPVERLVVEFSADTVWTGNAIRHAVRYLRPRPEWEPGEVGAPDL